MAVHSQNTKSSRSALAVLLLPLLSWVVLSSKAFAKDDEPNFDRPSTVQVYESASLLGGENWLELLKPGDLLILDLDNTVFREAQFLGTDDWYEHLTVRLLESGRQEHEIEDLLHDLTYQIKLASKTQLLEPELAKVIENLRQQGILVGAITARNRRMREITHKELISHGIDLSAPMTIGEVSSKLPGVLYDGHIAFGAQIGKGLVLNELLQVTGWNPEFVVAVDDRLRHVHAFRESLEQLNKKGLVIHYRASQKFGFDPELAQIQLEVFEGSGRLIGDAEARKVLCERALERGVE